MLTRTRPRSAIVVAAAAAMWLALVPHAYAAPAERPPRVPKIVSIIDQTGDANYLTTGWTNYLGVHHSGVSTQADASSAADIKAAWFDTKGGYLRVYIQVESLEEETTSLSYSVLADLQTDESTGLPVYCTQFHASLTGGEYPTNKTGPDAYFLVNCIMLEADIRTWEMPDGSGVVEIYVPRFLFQQEEFVAPVAFTAHTTDMRSPGANNYSQQFFWIDSTDPGEDYRL